MKYQKVFTAGLLISFLGSIPIGTLNISIVGLILNDRLAGAIAFGLGAIMMEMLLVWLTIVILKKIEKLKRILTIANILMCTILFVLAILSFMAAFQMEKIKNVIPFSHSYPFWAGMLLSFLNPLHLPFWLGWTAVLRNKKIWVEDNFGYRIYIVSIGLGTAISFMLYGFSGNLFVDFLKARQYVFNWIIAFTLLLTATIQSYKLLKSVIMIKKIKAIS